MKLFFLKQFLNFWPCIRGTGARVTYIAPDFHRIDVKVPLNWRTRNRVGTIFGGSIYASADPFYMIMLMHLLGKKYVVWDKGASIRFKRPGKHTLYWKFEVSPEQVAQYKKAADEKGEYNFDLLAELKDADGIVHAEVTKNMYVATKEFYKKKLERRNAS